jgi:hypothetical protein
MQVEVAFAASSISADTSTGIDASEAWLAERVTILLAPIRSASCFSLTGSIIRSALET